MAIAKTRIGSGNVDAEMAKGDPPPKRIAEQMHARLWASTSFWVTDESHDRVRGD